MRVKAADPRQVKLVLISWGVAIVLLIGLLTAFWAFSPAGSAELRQKADEAAMAEDYSQAIAVYDEFLKHYPKAPNANDVRLLRGLAELRLAEKKAAASGDWTPAFEVAQTQVKALPKDHTDSDVMQKFSIALAKIGEGLAQQAQGHPDMASVDRLQAVVNMLETDIPESNRPAKMIEEIKAHSQARQTGSGRPAGTRSDRGRNPCGRGSTTTSRRPTRPIASSSSRIPN